MTAMRVLVCACTALFLVAGCSSNKPVRSTSSSVPTTSAFSPVAAQDAALIAEHIPGCLGVQAGNVAGGAPDMSSTATCTLSGHLVIVDSYANATAAPDLGQLAGSELFYASGPSGWLAYLADQGATADQTTLHLQLVNDGGALAGESVDGDPYPPASIDAQRTLTLRIAHALGGHQGHVQPHK
jgi:hypothetical protein